MKRFHVSIVLSCLAFFCEAQDRPGSRLAVRRLENYIEATKRVAEASASCKTQIESRPNLNQQLIIAAYDFEQITRYAPSRAAYLQAMDRGLGRFDALLVTLEERYQVADFYVDLMDIVGVDSSDGRLDAFVANKPATLKNSPRIFVQK